MSSLFEVVFQRLPWIKCPWMFLYISFCGPMSSFLLCEYLEVELLDHRADMHSVHLTYCEKSVQMFTLLLTGLILFLLLHCSSLYILDTSPLMEYSALFPTSLWLVIHFVFWTGSWVCWWVLSKEGTVPKPLRVQGSPFSYGIMTRDVFDPKGTQDEPHFSCHSFKFICVELGKAPLLRDMDFLATRELELGPV